MSTAMASCGAFNTAFWLSWHVIWGISEACGTYLLKTKIYPASDRNRSDDPRKTMGQTNGAKPIPSFLK